MADDEGNGKGERPADAVVGNWVDHAPAWTQPYLRLARFDRPIGAWLLLWPCWWSMTLAGPGLRDLPLYLLFFIGAFAMRAAGCVYNDIVDRDIDAQVERTRHRPLASGALSLMQAILMMAGLMLIGLLVLLLMNPFAIALGASSLALVVIYPFAKRFTDWPQFVLGLAFNWGALLGWAAVKGSLGLAPVALYLGGICWTLGYDTIYAHQDKEDDAVVGVRSTALLFAEHTRLWLTLFYTLTILMFALSGWLADLHAIYYYLLALAALHLVVQIVWVDTDDSETCLKVFRFNHLFGVIVFAALVLAQLVAWVG